MSDIPMSNTPSNDPGLEPKSPVLPKPAPAEDTGAQALSEALGSGFLFIRILIGLLVVGLVFSCLKTVEPNERAVILQFGKPKGTGEDQVKMPGLHWVFPYPIDEMVKIPVGESHTIQSTIGWYAMPPGAEALGQEPPPREMLIPGLDGYTLTADGNIIHVRATLNYRISDPVSYAFNYVAATNILRNILNNALLHASASFTADDAIFRNKSGFSAKVNERVERLVADHRLGIALDPVIVETRPPPSVKPSFDAVLTAEADSSRKRSEAQGYADETVRKAVGEASAFISAGTTTSNQIVQLVSAEAAYFTELLPEFRKDPVLFQKRLQAEALSRVMTNAQDKFFLPTRADGKPRELRLQLNREPQKPSGQ